MKIIHETIQNGLTLPDHVVLFDIETTGLSADTSYLYLIGAIYQQENELRMTQWFCDSFTEEKELLLSFRNFLSEDTRLVHYNGCGFDIPYLNKKFTRYKQSFLIDSTNTIDIYKFLLPYRKLTTLPDFKQKTLEVLSGFHRTDTFDGGELIEVYAAYTGKYRLGELTGKKEEPDALRATLLLHNHDDLLGLLSLYQKVKIQEVLQGAYLPELIFTGSEIIFSYPMQVLPFDLKVDFSFGTLSVSKQSLDLMIYLYEGELKYYFSNYKEYSYLLYEDMAIHNSLAECVDKQAKQKCKPATAYQKKSGLFLPLPPKFTDIPDNLYLFYHDYKSLPAYVEFSKELLQNVEFTNIYVSAVLASIKKQ